MKRGILVLFLLFFLAPAFSLLRNQLSCESSGYTWMPNSVYDFGFFDFKNDEIGSSPTGWDYISGNSAIIIPELGGKENVMQVMSGTWIQRNFETQSSGEIEFYARVNQSSKYFSIYLIDEADNLAVRAYFHNSNNFQGVNNLYFSGSTAYSINTWYKIKITFDCSTKKWTMYANDVIVLNDFTFYDDVLVGGIKAFAFHNFDTHAGFADEISFSWDTDYKPGDNLMLGCCGDDIVDLRDGLVSEWHMDEGTGSYANDSIGGNHGTITGASWSAGKHGNALLFDGINSKVYAGSSDSLAINKSLTLSAWIYPFNRDYETKYFGLMAPIVARPGGGYSTANYGIQLSNLTRISFVHRNAGGLSYYHFDLGESLLNSWNHVIASVDNNVLSLYLNSKLIGTQSITSDGGIYPTTNFLQGVEIGGLGSYGFNGSIDEVRIYNRALSDRETAYLYDISPYKYIEYPDTFHNGTINVDASYCVNNDFYSSLEETPAMCSNAGFAFLTKDWNDYGFKYRKQITIDNSGTALTDYQININPNTYNTTGLVASYHFSEQGASIKDYSGNNNYGSLYGSTIGLWHFDESSGTSAYDSTGYIKNGILVGTPTWVKGINNYAIKTTANTQKIYAGALPTSSLSNITVSMWVNPITINGAYGRMLTLGTTTTAYDGAELALYTDGRLAFISLALGSGWVVTSYTPPKNVYTHFVYHLSNNGNIKIYANGVKIHDATYTPAVFSDYYITLGSRPDLNGENVYGEYDEVAVYKKALTDEEIKYLYESQKAQFIEYVSGHEGKGTGLEFNKSYVAVPDSASLRPGTGSFSLSIWFNAPNIDQVGTLFAKRQNGSPYEMYGLAIRGANSHNPLLGKKLNFNYMQVAGSIEKSGYTTRDIADGKWHHAVMVIDDALQKVIIYIDGKVESLTMDYDLTWPDLIDNPDTLYIGGSPDTSQYAESLIDEVLIYNRALSAQEVSDLYNERKGNLDYSDIIFYNSTGSELNYYHEYDNKFWVKVPSIPIGQSNITMHYGNPGAISKSYLLGMFDFYDDFESYIDGNPISTPWIISGGTWTVATDSGNKVLYSSAGTTDNKCFFNSLKSNDYIYELKAKKLSGTEGFVIPFQATLSSNYPWWNIGGWANTYSKVETLEGTTVNPQTIATGSWYDIKLMVSRTSNRYIGYINNTLQWNVSATPTSRTSGMGVGTWATTAYYDNVRIRKWSYPEPIITLQNEEYIHGNSQGLIAHYSFDQDIDNKTIDSINKNHSSLYGSTVGMWRFDEGSGTSVKDSTSYNNLGIIYGANFTSNSKSGTALSFDGVDDYVSGAGPINIDNSDFAMSGWFYDNGNSINLWAGLLVGEQYVFGRLLTPGRFLSHNGTIAIELAINAPTKTWNHIIVTHNLAQKKLMAYINGAEVRSIIYIGNLVATNKQFAIGSRTTTGTTFFNGTIDEVAIYNKSLTPDEVKYLYDSKKAQFMEHVQGVIGKGIELDGISHYVSIPDSNILDFSNNPFSILLWFNRKGNAVQTDESLIHKESGINPYGGYTVFIDRATQKINFRIRDSSNGYSTFTSSKSIALGWNHLAITYNLSGVNIQLNNEANHFQETRIIGATTNPLRIGQPYGAPNGYNFNGTIDDFRIYNRALSDSEIIELYSSTANNYGCCGNDYNIDTFYNGSIGTTTHFCQAGNLINQEIDANQTICTYYSYNWLTESSTSGSYPRCCNDDASNDLFSAFSADLLTSQSASCQRCNAGAFLPSVIYYGNGYMTGTGTIRNCYYGNIICSGNSGSNGTSSNIYGWGWYNDSLTTAEIVECKSSAATCLDGSFANDSSTILYGNGYKSGTTCYYGEITCSLDDEASGLSCTLSNPTDICISGQGCLNIPTLIGNASINSSLNSGLSSYINLTWSTSGFNPDGYYLEKSIDGITYTQLIQTASTNYVDYSATIDNTMHYYRIKAYYSTYNSTYNYLNISTNDRTAYNTSILYINNNINSATITNLMNDSGLVLYMPFEENTGTITKDWSVNNLTGTLTNTGAVWSEGKYGKSIDFQNAGGSSSGQGVVVVPDNNVLDISVATGFTISFWYKPDTNVCSAIIKKDGQFEIYRCSSVITARLWNSSLVNNNGLTALNNGQWYYVTVTHDGANLLKIYLNGILDNSFSITGTPSSLTNNLGIGAYATSEYGVDGKVDEVKIYNRALSQREIINDMQSGKHYFEIMKSNTTSNFSPLGGIIDDFNDGDYSNNPSWNLNSGSWAVNNGILKAEASACGNTMNINLGQARSDLIFEMDVNLSTASYAGFNFAGFWLARSGSSIQLWVPSGGWPIVVNAGLSYNKWARLKFIYSNSTQTIKGFVNDIMMFDYSSNEMSPSSTVYIGLGCAGAIAEYDNIKVTILNNNLVTDFSANDTVKPSTPLTPIITPISTTSLNISWQSVSDNGNIYYYYSKNFDYSGNLANILNNNGFEKDTAGTNVPIGVKSISDWTGHGNTAAGTGSQVVNSEKHSGFNSYNLSNDDDSVMTIYYHFHPELNKNYKVCFWAKKDSGTVYLRLHLDGTHYYDYPITTDWQQYCQVFSLSVDPTDIEFANLNINNHLYIDDIEILKIESTNIVSGVNSYQINCSDGNISGWTNSEIDHENLECFTNYSYSVKAKDNAENIGLISQASTPIYPISYIGSCSGALGFCINSQKCYVPFNCSGFDCINNDCNGGENISNVCVTELCDINGYSLIEHETINGCNCVSTGTCDEGYCEKDTICNYDLTCSESGWSGQQCSSTNGCVGNCTLGTCNYSLGGTCSAIGCGGGVSNYDPDTASQYCTGCSEEWTGSSCCGDDGNDESYNNEGLNNKCCYFGNAWDNYERQNSLLCYNGLMYDCNNQVSDSFSINSNIGDSKGEFTCSQNNNWTGNLESYSISSIEIENKLIYVESGSNALSGLSFNITNPSVDYQTYNLELYYTQGYSHFSQTKNNEQSITIPPKSTKTVYIDIYPTVVGEILYTLSALNANNPNEYFVRQFSVVIVMPIKDETGQIIYSADELSIFDFIVSFLNKIFFN